MIELDNDLLLVDLGSLFWRKWFATRSQIDTMRDVIDRIDFLALDFPSVIVCADSPKNWRHEVTAHLERSAQYKANRPRKEPEAVLSLVAVQERLTALGYPVIERDGYEADDVIATLARQANGRCVHVLSEDKDLFQLIGPCATQITRGGHMTRDECMRKFGIHPGQMHDWLALVGDLSDNVPGCPGVGPGKGAALLAEFGSIAGIQAATDDELLALRGIGPTIVGNLRAWDPEMALKLTSLSEVPGVNISEILAGYVSRVQSDKIAV